MEDIFPKRMSDIAIVSYSFRFPKSRTRQEFLDRILSDTDYFEEIPQSRWSIAEYYDEFAGSPGKTSCKWGSFLDDIDLSSTDFISMSSAELASTDPQQQYLLLLTHELLLNAGIQKDMLPSFNAGLFLSLGQNEHALKRLQQLDKNSLESLSIGDVINSDLSVIANRLANQFGINGPSMVINSGCASSIVAIHEARKSLLLNEIDIAVVGGANYCTSPVTQVGFSQGWLLSESDKMYSLDKKADGYLRGDGVGMVLLKRLEDALSDGDPIAGVIKSTAVNQNGKRSRSFFEPSLDAEIEVMEKALKYASLLPEDVTCIEAYGLGLQKSDHTELSSIQSVYASSRKNPLYVSSIKSQLGHLEWASGMASIIKALLCQKNQVISPQANFTEPHPSLTLSKHLIIPKKPITNQKIRYIGINAFGLGGTNAHLLLGPCPKDTSYPKETIVQTKKPVTSQKTPPKISRVVDSKNTYQAADIQHYVTHLLLQHISEKIKISIDTEISDLGIDSLKLIQICNDIGTHFSIVIPPIKLMELRTVKDMCDLISLTLSSSQSQRLMITNEMLSHPNKGLLLSNPVELPSLSWVPWHIPNPQKDNVQIRVHSAGINFPDLMCIHGNYPTLPNYPFIPGFEVSGIVTKVGKDVQHLQIGDSVIALTSKDMGGFSVFVNTHQSLVIKKSDSLTYDQAASLPIAYITASYSLHTIGSIKKGDKVLIHSAAGGVGQVAARMASEADAILIGTSSSPEKIKALKETNDYLAVLDYTSKTFKQDLLSLTDGTGVDIILNTLPSPYNQLSLECLSKQGKFIELAVLNFLNSHIDLKTLVNNQSIHSVDLRKLFIQSPLMLSLHLKQLEIEQEKYAQSLNITSFSHSNLHDAFHYLNSSHRIGKVALNLSQLHTAEDPVEDTYYPMTYGQLQYFKFYEKYKTGSELVMHVEFPPIDKHELSSILSVIQERHPILRATFKRDHANKAVTKIHKSLPIPITEVSIDQPIETFMRSKPHFDLEKEAGLKVYLVNTKTTFYLILCVHHIIIEARSGAILLKEIMLGVKDFKQLKRLPAPTYNYLHYAQIEQDFFENKNLPHHSFWEKMIKNSNPNVYLTDDSSRLEKHHYTNCMFQLPESVFCDVKTFATTFSLTLNTILLSAFIKLIQEKTTKSRFMISQPVLFDIPSELSTTIGTYLNFIPFCFDLEPEMTTTEFLNNTQHVVFETLYYGDYPQEKISHFLQKYHQWTNQDSFYLPFMYTCRHHSSKEASQIKLDALYQRDVVELHVLIDIFSDNATLNFLICDSLLPSLSPTIFQDYLKQLKSLIRGC